MTTYGSKKLAASGATGVLIALTIIATIIIVPWHTPDNVLLGVSVGSDTLLRLEGPEGVAYQEPMVSPPECVLNVTIYEFSKPLGPSSEGNLVITLTSKINASAAFQVNAKLYVHPSQNPEWQEDFPGGIEFLAGNSEWSWNGTIEANGTKTFHDGIRVTGIGSGDLVVDARSSQHFQSVVMYILTTPNNVFVCSLFPCPEPWLYMEPVGTTYDHYHGLSVGSEFNVSARVTGSASASGMVLTLRIIAGEGIVPIGGEPTWTGTFPLLNETADHYYVDLFARMRLVKPGAWFMCLLVEKNGILYVPPCIIKYESVGNGFIEKYMVG